MFISSRFVGSVLLVGFVTGCSPVIKKDGYPQDVRPTFSTKNPNETLLVATDKCKEKSKDKLLKCFLNLKSNCNRKVEDIDIIMRNPSTGDRYSNATTKAYLLGVDECNEANKISDTTTNALSSYRNIGQWQDTCTKTSQSLYINQCLDDAGFKATPQKTRHLEFEPWFKLNIIQ